MIGGHGTASKDPREGERAPQRDGLARAAWRGAGRTARASERDATRGARDALKRGALGRGAGDRPSPTLGDGRTHGHTVSKRLMPLVGNPLTSIIFVIYTWQFCLGLVYYTCGTYLILSVSTFKHIYLGMSPH